MELRVSLPYSRAQIISVLENGVNGVLASLNRFNSLNLDNVLIFQAEAMEMQAAFIAQKYGESLCALDTSKISNDIKTTVSKILSEGLMGQMGRELEAERCSSKSLPYPKGVNCLSYLSLRRTHEILSSITRPSSSQTPNSAKKGNTFKI